LTEDSSSQILTSLNHKYQLTLKERKLAIKERELKLVKEIELEKLPRELSLNRLTHPYKDPEKFNAIIEKLATSAKETLGLLFIFQVSAQFKALKALIEAGALIIPEEIADWKKEAVENIKKLKEEF
ncbi:5292_t:CDS:2, partial [Gigaspora margarita]